MALSVLRQKPKYRLRRNFPHQKRLNPQTLSRHLNQNFDMKVGEEIFFTCTRDFRGSNSIYKRRILALLINLIDDTKSTCDVT